MCQCSVLQRSGQLDASDKQELRADVVDLLQSLYHFLDEHKWLKGLPFSVKKTGGTSTKRTPKDRIAGIFDHHFKEYDTSALLQRNSEKWIDQPSSFFGYVKPAAHSTNDPEQYVLHLCLNLQQSDAHSQILRRIYCIVLHRIRKAYKRRESPKVIAELIHKNLHDDGNRNLDLLVTAIENIMLGGPTYETIGKELGYGSLCVLGTVVGPEIWEKRLPNSGELFREAMTHLKLQGVDKSGKQYDKFVEDAIQHLQSRLPKKPLLFVDGSKKRTTPPSRSSSIPKRSHCGVTRNRGQRGASGASVSGTADATSTGVRLEAMNRMAVQNLVSNYPLDESSLPIDSGMMNSSLSATSSTGGVPFIENRNMNGSGPRFDTIGTVVESQGDHNISPQVSQTLSWERALSLPLGWEQELFQEPFSIPISDRVPIRPERTPSTNPPPDAANFHPTNVQQGSTNRHSLNVPTTDSTINLNWDLDFNFLIGELSPNWHGYHPNYPWPAPSATA